jgi:hypothetical protein
MKPTMDPTQSAGLIESFDPAIIQVARQIYQDYCEVHPRQAHVPSGVVIDRFSYRGQIASTDRPVLLPQECFVTIKQILGNAH